ncbi:ribosome silencing factor [candidate division WOR-3 bacterium]|nr:ribosome silencing factor [candidate division WOR-3 bacterium]
MDSDNLPKLVMETMKKKKAEEIMKLDVSKVCDATDDFIICTAQTDIHSRALADTIVQYLKEQGVSPDHLEGYKLGRWVLLDYLNFVIHIFLVKERSYYNLEHLWGDVPKKTI